MLIDRTKALLLVGALAASACVVQKSDDGEAGGTSGSGGSGANGGTAGNGGSAGSSGGSAGATGGSAGTTGGTAGTTGGTGGSTGGTGGTGGATGGTGGSTGGTGGLTCDDDVGTPDCTVFPVPTAEGECDFRFDFCDGLTGKVKAARQAEAITCLTAITDTCNDYTAAYTCMDSMLANSCTLQDDGISAACNTVVLGCGTSVAQGDCETYVSGLTPDGSAIFLDCATNFCDLYTCAEGLPFTALEI